MFDGLTVLRCCCSKCYLCEMFLCLMGYLCEMFLCLMG